MFYKIITFFNFNTYFTPLAHFLQIYIQRFSLFLRVLSVGPEAKKGLLHRALGFEVSSPRDNRNRETEIFEGFRNGAILLCGVVTSYVYNRVGSILGFANLIFFFLSFQISQDESNEELEPLFDYRRVQPFNTPFNIVCLDGQLPFLIYVCIPM